MSLYITVKADALQARKQRDTATATSLTTLIGELETFAKNAGREPTDADVVTFVQKTLKNVDEVLRLASMETSAYLTAVEERKLFEKYLPKQLSTDELQELIDSYIKAGATNVGSVMKLLKTNHNGQYDGSQAATILKEKFK